MADKDKSSTESKVQKGVSSQPGRSMEIPPRSFPDAAPAQKVGSH